MHKTPLIALAAAVLASAGAASTAGYAPIAAAATVRAGNLSDADQARVQRARDYLQSLGAVKGRFTQTDHAGRVAGGIFYLQRPGKARFEYDPPSGLLIVADGQNVNMYDKRLKTFQKTLLVTTPLHIFLARDIRLDKRVTVDRVTSTPGGFTLSARETRKSNAGRILMTFSDNPLRLTHWTVVDVQGRSTRVALSGVQPASPSPNLFVLRDPGRPSGGR